MKAAIFCLSFLLLLFGGSYFYSAQMADTANAFAKQAKILITVEDNECQEKIKTLDEEWRKKEIWFSLSIPHGELDRIETELVRISAAAKAKDDGEFQIAVALLADAFEHIGKLYEASPDNIL